MKKRLRSAFEYIAISVLAVIMAFNYEIFVFRNAFAPAGINGIATMVQYLFDFSVGYMSLLINIPLSLLAFFYVDKKFALRSGVFTIMFSLALLLLKRAELSALVYHTANGTSTILAPVAAGTVNGAIYGAAVKLGGSTGGTDIIAACIRVKMPYFSFARVTFVLNAIVAGASFFVYDFNFEPVIMCIIFNFIASNICDYIVKGGLGALKFEVITSHAEEMSAELMKKLHHGVTVINAEGMYTHSGKQVIICVINKHQIVDFQSIVRSYPDTFAYVSSVSETVGNFKKIR